MNKLDQVLQIYITDPRDGMNNFNVGRCYEEYRQFSAAIGFYIRTAEYGTDMLLTYEALLRIAICLEIQGKRVRPQKGAILRAVSVKPNRPEAYFLMARTYEIQREWHEAYAWSFMGEKVIRENRSELPLLTDVQYPGPYGFIYERAVVAWWIGLYYESLELFRLLKRDYKMLAIHAASVESNITNVINILKSKGKPVE